MQDGLCSHVGWRCCFSLLLFLTKTSGQGLQVAVAKRETVRCRGKAARIPQEPLRPPGCARPACSISFLSTISSANFFPSLQRGKRIPGGVPRVEGFGQECLCLASKKSTLGKRAASWGHDPPFPGSGGETSPLPAQPSWGSTELDWGVSKTTATCLLPQKREEVTKSEKQPPAFLLI